MHWIGQTGMPPRLLPLSSVLSKLVFLVSNNFCHLQVFLVTGLDRLSICYRLGAMTTVSTLVRELYDMRLKDLLVAYVYVFLSLGVTQAIIIPMHALYLHVLR